MGSVADRGQGTFEAMASAALRLDLRGGGLALLAFGGACAVGLLAARQPLEAPFLVVGALAVGTLAFIRTELAIHLVVLSMLLSPEFSVGGSVGAGAEQPRRHGGGDAQSGKPTPVHSIIRSFIVRRSMASTASTENESSRLSSAVKADR